MTSVGAAGQEVPGSTTSTTTTTSTSIVLAPIPPGGIPAGVIPPAPPTPDPSPHIRVLLARLDVLAAQEVVDERRQSADLARDGQAAAQEALAETQRNEATAEGTLREARAGLGSTAVFAYMHSPSGDLASVMQGDPTTDGEEHELFTVSIDHHHGQVRDAQAALDLARQDVDTATQVLAAAQQTAVDRDGEVAASFDVLDDARAELADARAEAQLPFSSWSLPIEGTSAFTADELAEWYETQGQVSSASVPITELTRLFVDQGDAEDVRGDMAFAQSIHETGWFTNRDTIFRNNFAGVGHCDSCAAGFSYRSAQLGVLAQLQLLKSYAEADPTYQLPRADPDLDGPAGCCPTWADLGGVWATDGGYGPRILGRYAEMLEWLVAERSAQPS